MEIRLLREFVTTGSHLVYNVNGDRVCAHCGKQESFAGPFSKRGAVVRPHCRWTRARKFLAAWDRKTTNALAGTKSAQQFPQASTVRVLTPARLRVLRLVAQHANSPRDATAEFIAAFNRRSVGSIRAALNWLWKKRFVKPVGAAGWRVTEAGRAAIA